MWDNAVDNALRRKWYAYHGIVQESGTASNGCWKRRLAYMGLRELTYNIIVQSVITIVVYTSCIWRLAQIWDTSPIVWVYTCIWWCIRVLPHGQIGWSKRSSRRKMGLVGFIYPIPISRMEEIDFAGHPILRRGKNLGWLIISRVLITCTQIWGNTQINNILMQG
mgnify:CR=1 FL=1